MKAVVTRSEVSGSDYSYVVSGNDGGPMNKMNKFSSWNADAVLARYMVDADMDFMLDMKENLEAEYQRWECTNRLQNGLYWQGDVQDGMEESISGGRKKSMPAPPLIAICMVMQKALSLMGIFRMMKEWL